MHDPDPKTDPTVAVPSNAVPNPRAVPAPSVTEPITSTTTGSGASGADEQTQVRSKESTARVAPAGVPGLSGYELSREIARGGMGVVYAARDLSLDREVAVKVMLPRMDAAEFVRESRVTARLPHPGIPPVYALGTLPEPDGRPFLAMKLIKGETLDKLLKSRTDPSADRGRFVAAFEQMCQAVGYAHAQGIIHRDLKPANVMVGAFGEVQVMDWGLAKVVGTADAGATVADGGGAYSEDVAATVAGTVKGTPAYMAPEQARGESVDARADVFALGGILAVMLTGKPPFAGNSVLDTIIRAASAELDDIWSQLDDCGADTELVEVAKWCLSAASADRPANGEAVAVALSAYRAGVDARLRQSEQDRAAAEAKAAEAQNTRREAEAREREQRKRRRVQLALAVVVAAGLAGAGVATNLVLKQQSEDRLTAEKKQSDERVAAEEKRLADLRGADQQRAAELKAADQEAKQKQRQTRADGLVKALESANTPDVPRIIDDLREFRDLTGPNHRALASQPVTTKPGLHGRLALLADEPGRAAELSAYLMACRPDELLTICGFLAPHGQAVGPGLWAVLTDTKADPGKRVRAACACAVLTPGDVRWGGVAAAVTEFVVRANPVEFVAWSAALEPVRGVLLPKLMERYLAARESIRVGKLDESAIAAAVSTNNLTANLLAQYAKDRPAELAELSLIADPRHYTLFAGALNANKLAVVPVLKAEMAKSVVADWKDSPLNPEWVLVEPATVKSVEAGDGLVHERFALVQSVPLAEFEALANALGRSGYRPVRVRPYTTEADIKVAAVWRRDGVAWGFLSGATATDVWAKDDELRAKGFQPVDVAGWVDPDIKPHPVEPFAAVGGGPGGFAVSSAPALRFAVVWEAAPDGKPVNRMYLGGEGTTGHRAGFAAYQQAKLLARTVQAVGIPGVGTWYSGVWGDVPGGSSLVWIMTPATYLAGKPNQVGVDFTFSPDRSGVQKYAAVWYGGLGVEVEQPTGLSVAEQLAKGKELAAAGWRPAALGVAKARLSASVWHRPVIADVVLAEQGKRRGYAAAVLLTLGEAEAVWPVFAFPKDGDPTTRSYLQERLAAIGADPAALVRRFGAEADVWARRGLLIALGDFPAELVPAGEREPFVSRLLGQYRDDPDSGLHSAIDWLLRQKWGKAKELAAIDAELARRARGRGAARALVGTVPPGPLGAVVGPQLPAPLVAVGKDWFVNGEGQTFAVVWGPVEFTQGSPPSEPSGFEGDVQHQKRIGRNFAMATKEVTSEEYLRFRPTHKWDKRYSPDTDTPALSVNWYQAAEYCNWLSAREGIYPDQWCYEPNKDGQFTAGMRIKRGHLELTGYRLPTEAEWEYACRAGSVTSRYYGRGEELLPRYGWFLNTAEERAWSVGRLRPNEIGLFDMLGNALEWCEDPVFGYTPRPAEDIENTQHLVLDPQFNRILRGAAFKYQAMYMRSANRDLIRPGSGVSYTGFRPAKTLP